MGWPRKIFVTEMNSYGLLDVTGDKGTVSNRMNNWDRYIKITGRV